MKSGIELIAEERKEQIEKHGRTIEADVEINPDRQLAVAAKTLLQEEIEKASKTWVNFHRPEYWDEIIFERMCKKPYKERLVIAGALIAAEIDRLNYMEN